MAVEYNGQDIQDLIEKVFLEDLASRDSNALVWGHILESLVTEVKDINHGDTKKTPVLFYTSHGDLLGVLRDLVV
jgi:hypothetical protein